MHSSTPVISIPLDDSAIAQLADALADRIAARLPENQQDNDRWLDSSEAAVYLGITRSALHKLSAAGEVPCSQDVAGGKLYFKRSRLDSWRDESRQGPI